MHCIQSIPAESIPHSPSPRQLWGICSRCDANAQGLAPGGGGLARGGGGGRVLLELTDTLVLVVTVTLATCEQVFINILMCM